MEISGKKNYGLWAIIAILIFAAVVAGFYFATKNNGQAPPTGNTHENVKGVTITYTNDGFGPDTYMVKKGGMVTVKNNSDHDLQFSSDPHPVHTGDPELNMGILKPGSIGSFQAEKVGTFGFHNHLRSEDTGKLTVME